MVFGGRPSTTGTSVAVPDRGPSASFAVIIGPRSSVVIGISALSSRYSRCTGRAFARPEQCPASLAVVAFEHPPRFAVHIPGGNQDGHRNREVVQRRQGL